MEIKTNQNETLARDPTTKGNLRRELIFDFFCQLRSLKARFFDFDFDLLILQKPVC